MAYVLWDRFSPVGAEDGCAAGTSAMQQAEPPPRQKPSSAATANCAGNDAATCFSAAGESALFTGAASASKHGIHWGLLRQELFYIAVMLGDRLIAEQKARRELKGPFFKD